MKFWQLIQKKYAVMGERNLTGARTRAATDERRHACGVMRRAEWTIDSKLPADKLACKRLHHRDFENFRHCVANAPTIPWPEST